MGKGYYLGGGTLIGRGPLVKEKRFGKGGLGSGAALREQRRVALKQKRKENSEKIKANESLAKQIGKEWAAEKGRTHYTNLVHAERAKLSPLAEALRKALAKEYSYQHPTPEGAGCWQRQAGGHPPPLLAPMFLVGGASAICPRRNRKMENPAPAN